MGTNTLAVETEQLSPTSKRIVSIDRFRGIVVFLMVLFEILNLFDNLGIFSMIGRHPVNEGLKLWEGLTLADLGAPMFMFAIALTYELSFNKRVAIDGRNATLKHSMIRWASILSIGTMIDVLEVPINGEWEHPLNYVFVALLGIMLLLVIAFFICGLAKQKKAKNIIKKIMAGGAFVTAVLTVISGIFDIYLLFEKYCYPVLNAKSVTINHWSTLESIGAAGLIALIAVGRKTWVKLAIGSGIFAVYTVVHQLVLNMDLVKGITQGGPIGAFGWASIIIFGMVIADLFKDKKYKQLALLTVVFAGLSVLAIAYIEICKKSVSPSYVLLTTFTNIIFYLIVKIFDKVKIKNDFFVWWGKNPFVMYMVSLLIIFIYESAMPKYFLPSPPVWLGVVQIIVLTVAFTALCWFMNKKKMVVKI